MATSGPPSLQTHAGLTPKVAIVNADGTPTMFFFRFLLTLAGQLLTLTDIQTLEAFDPGGDAAIAGTQLDALASDQRALEALIGAPPPAGVDSRTLAAMLWTPPHALELTDAERAFEALMWAPPPVAAAPATVRNTIANIPHGLGAGDAGSTFYATDYQHGYRWTGSGWTFGDGDAGSGFIRWFLTAPRAGLWQLCDGSTGVFEAIAAGTLAPVQFAGLAAGTMPNLIGGAYLSGAGAASGVVQPATVVASGSGATGEPAHLGALPYYRL